MTNDKAVERKTRALAEDVQAFIEDPNYDNYIAVSSHGKESPWPCAYVSILRDIDCEECQVKVYYKSSQFSGDTTRICLLSARSIIVNDEKEYKVHEGEVLLCMIKLFAMLEKQIKDNCFPCPFTSMYEE